MEEILPIRSAEINILCGFSEVARGVRMTEKKIFVSDDSTATILCPSCSKYSRINVDRFRNDKSVINIKCTCQLVFKVRLEFRKNYRKEVHLPGEYISRKDARRMRVIVKNISMRGVGFDTLEDHNLVLEDVLKLKFRLDDKCQTEINRDVAVRFLKGRYVGTEFPSPSQEDKDLGFYLMP